MDHSHLRHGAELLAVDGTLTAASASPSKAGVPSFDSNSLLRAHLQAVNIDVYDLQRILSQNLPLTGSLSAQIDADGPLRMLNGNGWVQLDNGVIYGEPVTRVRAQGKMNDDVVQLASVTLNDAVGN